ncbi:hypothetical protein [Streptacidiphilus fuscans]|uniref:Uncharacterized protein n=1 Tax=Streptacidiphilus fuscans TaxID=2789292 RepID=A0A931BC52_9ACTN|nr:hypothetical protein [Streptacidiphilus fuscans]MBF9072537.1 hypothetical protein [Streptacidiphilus fuscans]
MREYTTAGADGEEVCPADDEHAVIARSAVAETTPRERSRLFIMEPYSVRQTVNVRIGLRNSDVGDLPIRHLVERNPATRTFLLQYRAHDGMTGSTKSGEAAFPARVFSPVRGAGGTRGG